MHILAWALPEESQHLTACRALNCISGSAGWHTAYQNVSRKFAAAHILTTLTGYHSKTYWDAIWIFVPDSRSFCLSLFCKCFKSTSQFPLLLSNFFSGKKPTEWMLFFEGSGTCCHNFHQSLLLQKARNCDNVNVYRCQPLNKSRTGY